MLDWAGRIAANNFCRFNEGKEGCAVSRAAETDSEQNQQVGQQQQVAASPSQGNSPQTSAAEAAGAPPPPQQQQQQQEQLAQHGVQSQLQRLQLAQRSLWECNDVSCQKHDAPPGDAHGSRLVEPGPDPLASSDVAPSSNQNCIGNGVSEQPSEQPAAWHTELHAGQPPADQPQCISLTAAEAPKPEAADVVEGTVAQPCGIASAGASVTAHPQPIGRELFITASYFNHS